MTETTRRPDQPVRVRIVTLPADKLVEGLDMHRFEVGRTYEIGPRLAELLVRTGHAALDRREADRRNRREPSQN